MFKTIIKSLNDINKDALLSLSHTLFRDAMTAALNASVSITFSQLTKLSVPTALSKQENYNNLKKHSKHKGRRLTPIHCIREAEYHLVTMISVGISE